MDVDIRDVLGTPEDGDFPAIAPFPFVHKVYRNTQSIVVAPMLPYDVRNDNKLRKAKLAAKTGKSNQPIIDGLDNSLKDFAERHGGRHSFDYQQEQKQYLIHWPDNVHLDGDCLAYNDGEKKMELKLQGHVYTVDIPSLNRGKKKTIQVENDDGMSEEVTVYNFQASAKLIWRVADKNIKNRKLGDLDIKKLDKSTKAAMSMLEDLGIG